MKRKSSDGRLTCGAHHIILRQRRRHVRQRRRHVSRRGKRPHLIATQSSLTLFYRMARCIFIGQIGYLEEADIAAYFSSFGKVQSLRVLSDHLNRCAFLTFECSEDAKRVLEKK